jgi:hypothetical protein
MLDVTPGDLLVRLSTWSLSFDARTLPLLSIVILHSAIASFCLAHKRPSSQVVTQTTTMAQFMQFLGRNRQSLVCQTVIRSLHLVRVSVYSACACSAAARNPCLGFHAYAALGAVHAA